MTPADIPSLVAKTRAIADVVRNAGGAALYRKDLPDLDAIADALDAISPKEAELVKPLAAMTMLDEQLEVEHPGWMAGKVPERPVPPKARLVKQGAQFWGNNSKVETREKPDD